MRTCFSLAIVAILGLTNAHSDDTLECFELRTYTANEGKLDDLHSRFREHTLGLFVKHGMTNIGYWTPQSNAKNQLIYLLGYPSRAAREASWKGFFADPDWKSAFQNSTISGRLVKKVESIFLKKTDYSPAIQIGKMPKDRAFELRIYTASEGNLSHLNARFANHTIALFAKHGIGNFAYFNLFDDQKDADKTLIYLLTHKSRDDARASFSAFVKDPDWRSARAASEEKAGGSLTISGGVKSFFLNPTDYSPTN